MALKAEDVFGALTGKMNSILSGVKSHKVEGNKLIFTFTDDSTATMTFREPEDGVSVIGARLVLPNKLYFDYSDGSETYAGEIPLPEDRISKKYGNLLKNDGGLYVGSELVKNGDGKLYLSNDGTYRPIDEAEISPKEGNLVKDEGGLYVGSELTKTGKGDKYLADNGQYYEIETTKISPLAGNEIIDKEGVYLSKDMLKIPEISVSSVRPSGTEIFWVELAVNDDEPDMLKYKGTDGNGML